MFANRCIEANPFFFPIVDNRAAAVSGSASIVETQFEEAVNHFYITVSQETAYNKLLRFSVSWKEDVRFESSPSELLHNESYLKIITMGKNALPFIFNDLKKHPDHWFIALTIITGINPVPKQYRGNLPQMTKYWMEWAQNNNYVK